MQYKIGINIHAPKEKVYETLFDIDQCQHWLPDFWRMQLIKGTAGNIGATYTFYINFNKPKLHDQVLMNFTPSNSISLAHLTDYYNEEFKITLTEKGALVTFISLEGKVEFESFMAIFDVLPPIFFKARRGKYLVALKQYLEAPPKIEQPAEA